jgi:hypothetical protein
MRNIEKAIENYKAFIDTEFLPIQCDLDASELNYFFNMYQAKIYGGAKNIDALWDILTSMFMFAYYSGMKYGQKTMKRRLKK